MLTGFVGYSVGQRRSHRELDDSHGPPSKRSKGNDGRGRGLYGDPVRISAFLHVSLSLTNFLSLFRVISLELSQFLLSPHLFDPFHNRDDARSSRHSTTRDPTQVPPTA